MRLPLATLEIFAAIARHGSLRAAADALGIKPSTVSHQLKSLEAQIGAALFIRTTRSLSLTEAGRTLLRGAGPAFEQLTEAFESAQATGQGARGKLRLAMPDFVFTLLLGNALARFGLLYPDIELDLRLTDAFSNILDEGLHAGFRLGDRIAQDMVAVRICPAMDLAVVASPDYLSRTNRPNLPEDLLTLQCVRYRFQSSGRFAPWIFRNNDGEFQVDVSGNVIANTIPTSLEFARHGLGLVYTFRDYCVDDFAQGALVSVLEEHLPQTSGVYIYFPREYRSMVPLRLLIDHLRNEI